MLTPFRKVLVCFLAVCSFAGLISAKGVTDKPTDVSMLKAKPFTQAKLVKEWILKDIDPKLPLYIVSLTANKYGVYVLAMNVENGSVINTIENFWIQRYTHDGVFLSQWNGVEANQKFIKPDNIASDKAGNIYIADRGANKIKKFSHDSKFLSWWKIDIGKEIDKNDRDRLYQGGLAVFGDKYLYVYDPYSIYKFDTSGRLLKTIKPRMDFWVETDKQYKFISDRPFINASEQSFGIKSIDVNGRGELFSVDLFPPVVCKITEDGTINKWYVAVLNEGFEPSLNPTLWKEYKDDSEIKKYNTTVGGEMGYFDYLPYSISSWGELLFVTLMGVKPFGIIDAIIVDSRTGNLSYFKQRLRSSLREFPSGPGNKYLDKNVVVAFHDNDMFLGRTTKVEEVSYKKHIVNIIQKHELSGK